MNDSEKQEILLWAGGAFFVVLVIGIFMWTRSDTDASDRARAEGLHRQYEAYYVDPVPNKVPLQQLQKKMAEVMQEQEGEETLAVTAAVFPGNGSQIPEEIRTSPILRREGTSFLLDYDTARNLLSRVNNRLRSDAARKDIQIPGNLPFEGSRSVEITDQAARAGQMVQMTAFALLMDLLLESGVKAVREFSFPQAQGAWRDPTDTYARFTVGMKIVCSYEVADVLMRGLRDHRSGLALHQWSMQSERDQDFIVDLVAALTVPVLPDWKLPVGGVAKTFAGERQSVEASSAPKQATGVRDSRSSGPRSSIDTGGYQR